MSSPITPEHRRSPEDIEESLLEGDIEPRARAGTARAALRVRPFRVLWLGQLGSSIGTWMQTFAIGLYIDNLTKEGLWVGVATAAQLAPLLFVPIIGGVAADRFDRRRLLITLQSLQMLFALGLALAVAGSDDPSKLLILSLIFGGGVCNALNAPAWAAVLPVLVGTENLPGAISLNSAAINGSRVVGPALAGQLYPYLGASWLFLINAATFLFIIGSLFTIHLPRQPTNDRNNDMRSLTSGFRAARADPVVGWTLIAMTVFSLLCLSFVQLFPTIGRTHLGLSTSGIGRLYAAFGLGALAGSLAIGTFLAGRDKFRLARMGFAGFAVMMALFAIGRPVPLMFPTLFVLGFFYFGTTTSLLTVVQTRIDDTVRGRVMGLWFMSFGGTIALCGLVFGPLLDATNARVVLSIAAVSALALSLSFDLARIDRRPRTGVDVSRADGRPVVPAPQPDSP
jgi:MFS family permease